MSLSPISVVNNVRQVLRYNLILALLIVVSMAKTVVADDSDITGTSLIDLPLENILDITISTASKEDQVIEKAPAIIDVISEARIRDFGAKNLYELLSYLPGIEVMETYFGRTVLQFRGVMNVHYANKILLMVNGKPFYEPVNGSFFLEAISIASIAQIEIIRGPGSALYGTNAYSGIINVITKKGKDENDSFAVEYGYGSFDSSFGSISGKYDLTDDLGIFFAAEVFNSDGYNFDVKQDEKGNSANLDYTDRGTRIFTNISYKDFSLDIGYFSQEKRAYGITPVVDYSGLFERSSIFTNAVITHQFTPDFTTKLTFRYNHYASPDGDIKQFPFAGFGGHEESDVHLDLQGDVAAVELETNYKFNSKLSNISGVVYEVTQSDPYLFVWDSDGATHPFSAYLNNYDSYSLAGFTQFQYNISRDLNAVTGIRVVDDKDEDKPFFLPRFGAIYELNDNHVVKLLYGKAFRSPTFFEKYVSTSNVLYGSSSLDAEEIQTLDLALESKFQSTFKFRLNGFVEWIKNGIARIPTSQLDLHGPSAAIYSNESKNKIYGVEFSLDGMLPSSKGYYGFNVTYKEGEDKNTNQKLQGFANVTSNLWLNYRLGNGVFLTPSLQYVGERKGTLVSGSGYSIDDYCLVNMVLGYSWNNWTFTIVGKNLFDDNYSYPEYVRRNIEEIPGGAGRSIFGNMRYQF